MMLVNYQHPSSCPSPVYRNVGLQGITHEDICSVLPHIHRKLPVRQKIRKALYSAPCLTLYNKLSRQRIQERADTLLGCFTAESGAVHGQEAQHGPRTILQHAISVLLQKRKGEWCFVYPSDVPELISITCQEPEQGWVQRLDWGGLETAWQRALN